MQATEFAETFGSTDGAPYKHTVRLSGLTPDTEYKYRVECGGVQYSNKFRTAPSGAKKMRFICYSDSETEPESTGEKVKWDDPNDDASSRTYFVDQTTGYASNIVHIVRRKPDLILISGDLAEQGSRQADWDEFWKHNAGTINDPAGSIPILASPGNHEYNDYSLNYGENGLSKYLSYFDFNPNNAAVDNDQKERFHRLDYGIATFLFLDLNNGENPKDPNGPYVDADFAKDTNFWLKEGTSRAPLFNEGSAQWNWLEAQLKELSGQGRFVFVISHQCPYSVGYHGRVNGANPEEYLSGVPTRELVPLIAKYGVTAWICGHDEIYEHSVVTKCEIDGVKTDIAPLHVYDVGYAGDGLRGRQRTPEPNEFEVFRAHVDAPEVWENGILVSGGKHYGHLEINIDQNAKGEWEATLTPAYVFVSQDANGQATHFERREYDDKTVIARPAVSGGGDNNGDNGGSDTPTEITPKMWSGANGSAWDDAANWEPVGVPTAANAVTISSGTVLASAVVNAASLTIADGATLMVGSTGSADYADINTIADKRISLNVSQNLFCAGTLVVGGQPDYAVTDYNYYAATNVSVTIGGDFTLSGSGKAYIYAAEMIGDNTIENIYKAASIVSVGGALEVKDTATLVPIANMLTGVPVKFEAASFTLDAGATVNADNRGWYWTKTNDPRKKFTDSSCYTLAYGPSTSWDKNASHGGANSTTKSAYGYPYAPFLPGSPCSQYNGFKLSRAGGGVVWIDVQGKMTINGTISAIAVSGAVPGREFIYGANSGGSIWLLGQAIEAGADAMLSAFGGINGHGGAKGGGSGGRISLGLGLSDEEKTDLAGGMVPSDLGLSRDDKIVSITTDVIGGLGGATDENNIIYPGPLGTVSTVYGSASQLSCTIAGAPLEIGAVSPEYGAFLTDRQVAVPCTAPATALDPNNSSIRYTCLGYVVSNQTTEVASGNGTSVSITPVDEPLTLTWLWGNPTMAIPVEVPQNASILINGEIFTASGSYWAADDTLLSLSVVPDEGYEFLFWEGDVTFGNALKNPISFTASELRNVKPVLRSIAEPTTKTFTGGTKKWSDANSWNPAGVPSVADDVIIASGTCLVSNYAACASLTIKESAKMQIAHKASDKLEEARLLVAGDICLTNKAVLTVGAETGSDYWNGIVDVEGDFCLYDTASFTIGAGPTNETRGASFVNGAGWVTVGGKLQLSGSSVVKPYSAPWTGGSVVFQVKELIVEKDASVLAVEAGWQAVKSRIPQNISLGQGYSYTTAAGYGGYGLGHKDTYGKIYGSADAPIYPGSAKGSQYGDIVRRGGGLIRIHADSRTRIEGTFNASARAKDTDASSCSGGGIWVTSGGKVNISTNAILKARGGYEITGAGNAYGGGGRIAFTSHVSREQVAAMAETGSLPKTMARLHDFTEEFLAAHTNVNVQCGNISELTGDLSENNGTVRYLDIFGKGFFMILR